MTDSTPYARRLTRTVYVGKVAVGGGHPISIQSMNNTPTADIKSTLGQLHDLAKAGADIGRLAVVDEEAAQALAKIVKDSPLPLVADIHFDYRLAIKALEAGVAGLRINPGNIGSRLRVREVALRAKERQVPIRIGVNGGSLERDLLNKYGGITADALCDSAMKHVRILEEEDFTDIKISLKSSEVSVMINAYRQISQMCDYPLHLGVTEAGTYFRGSLKSALGLAPLLAEGIGDTMRVSLSGDPIREVSVAKEILSMMGIRREGWEFVSCPTCGRTQIDVEKLAIAVERELNELTPPRPAKVAVMGCAVNGPGEAADADFGIAGGIGGGIIFAKGKVIGRFAEQELLPALIEEIKNFCIK